jgi:acyl carrier protein
MEADQIREFIKSQFNTFEIASFGDEDNIFEMGLVDSPFAIMLVMFLESEFGVDVLDTDMDIDNFCSVKRIEEFVKRKLVTK